MTSSTVCAPIAIDNGARRRDALITMDAFDADVVIYAASPDHPLGKPVRRLLGVDDPGARSAMAVGSVLLLPDVLSHPLRRAATDELESLSAVLARIDLRSIDESTARLATVFAATYRLKAIDAIHLATAVSAGAERFISNTTRDFSPSIAEITIVSPDAL